MSACSCSVMSNSLWPFRLWCTRLLCPWDFSGKNTEVSCHFLFRGNFPNQESNPCLPCLLHCRWILSLLSQYIFATPWTAAQLASLSFTISQSLLKFMSIESVMLPNKPHPLPPPSPFAFNLSQHQGLFQWVSSLHQVAKVLEFQLQHQSFQWIFRTEFL